MRIEDEVPPYEGSEKVEGSKQKPEPESLSNTPDLEVESVKLDDKNESDQVSDKTEPLIEPESISFQTEKSSGKTFLILLFIILFAGLSFFVYLFEDKRSKTLLEIQEKLARMDLRMEAMQTEKFNQALEDLTLLKQDFQTLKKYVSGTLDPSRIPPNEPKKFAKELPDDLDQVITPQEIANENAPEMVLESLNEQKRFVKELPDDLGQVITPQEIVTEIVPEMVLKSSDNLQAKENEVNASGKPYLSTIGDGKTSTGEFLKEFPQLKQPLPSIQTNRKSKESLRKKVERSEEAQKYIDFVESTAAKLLQLIKKGASTIWSYLVNFFG